MSEAMNLIATPSLTVGPFFHFGIVDNDRLGCLVQPDTVGRRIRLRVRVLDGDGIPLPDALVELLQADADGVYAPRRAAGQERPSFSGFGRLATDADGSCVFDTVYPGRVSDGSGGRQAAHVNVCLFARGLLRHIYTRIYFADDPSLGTDPILTLVPEERRSTLVAQAAPDERNTFELTMRLQGDDETVFFDL